MRDVVVRNEENGAFLIELDSPIDDAKQPAVEPALPFDCGPCPQFDFATRETLEVGKLDQRPLEPRRADLESVGSRRKDVGMDVERRRDVSTHTCAIVQRHSTPILLGARQASVDDDPNYGPTPLTLIAHIDQVHPMRVANGAD